MKTGDFLAAISASPRDANARLMFADWLEEHGNTLCHAWRVPPATILVLRVCGPVNASTGRVDGRGDGDGDYEEEYPDGRGDGSYHHYGDGNGGGDGFGGGTGGANGECFADNRWFY